MTLFASGSTGWLDTGLTTLRRCDAGWSHGCWIQQDLRAIVPDNERGLVLGSEKMRNRGPGVADQVRAVKRNGIASLLRGRVCRGLAHRATVVESDDGYDRKRGVGIGCRG
jgi:hypothetical protein